MRSWRKRDRRSRTAGSRLQAPLPADRCRGVPHKGSGAAVCRSCTIETGCAPDRSTRQHSADAAEIATTDRYARSHRTRTSEALTRPTNEREMLHSCCTPDLIPPVQAIRATLPALVARYETRAIPGRFAPTARTSKPSVGRCIAVPGGFDSHPSPPGSNSALSGSAGSCCPRLRPPPRPASRRSGRQSPDPSALAGTITHRDRMSRPAPGPSRRRSLRMAFQTVWTCSKRLANPSATQEGSRHRCGNGCSHRGGRTRRPRPGRLIGEGL